MPETTAIVSGKLRHRIQIAEPSYAQDTAGGVSYDVSGLSPIATLWASVEALTGRLREVYGAQQKVGEIYYRVTIRWTDGVHSRQFIWWDGRTLQILQVENPDGRRKMLHLICIERDESSRTPGESIP